MNTYWNGELANCRKVRVIVEEADFPLYWAREFVGQERDAVEVNYGGNTFYLDDDEGHGWDKVTYGYGSPRYSHRSLSVSNVRGRGGE